MHLNMLNEKDISANEMQKKNNLYHVYIEKSQFIFLFWNSINSWKTHDNPVKRIVYILG